MKTIIIGGVCRTGKSRLAKTIYENTKSTVFHADHLMNALYNNFPNSIQDNFPQVLIKLVRNMGKEFNYTRIFESSHFDPLVIKHKLNYPNYTFLFLGYPRANINHKLKQLREYGKKHQLCWTNQHNDESLISLIKTYIKLSQEHQQKCQLAKIPYFDTSENFQFNWNRAYHYLIDILNHS